MLQLVKSPCQPRWRGAPVRQHRQRKLAQVVRSSPSEQPPQNTDEKAESPASAPASTSGRIDGDDKALAIPKNVIEQMKNTVFGIDTFWVTSVENYQENGVLFKGNVRAKNPGAAFTKMKERMKAQLGDRYQIFLLEDTEEKPTAVVLPSEAATDGMIKRVTEVWLALAFAVASAVTTINSNGVPLFQWLLDPMRTELTVSELQDALPCCLAFWFILGAHEWGHHWAARRRGVELYLPFVIPAGFGFLGAFGTITRIKGFVPNRATLLDIAVSGPAVGTAVSLAAVLLGFVLSAAGATDVSIDTPSFADSLFMATLAQVFMGNQLSQPVAEVNSLLIAGWAGLTVNALNCVPMGELDGGRISLAVLGRGGARLLGALTAVAMGLGSLNSTLAFYWIITVLVLQRGPIIPCQEELSSPLPKEGQAPPEPQDVSNVWLGTALLALPLLVLVPFPVQLIAAIQDLASPVPVF